MCKMMGLSLDTFYRYKAAVLEFFAQTHPTQYNHPTYQHFHFANDE